MDSLALLFRPHQVYRARSEKQRTVDDRECELRCRGVYTAELKIMEKWGKLCNRAINDLRKTDAYKRLAVLDIEQCKSHVQQFRDLLDRGHDTEIESVRAIARAYPDSVPPSSKSIVSTPQFALRKITLKSVILVRHEVKAPPLTISSVRDHDEPRSSPRTSATRCPRTLQCI
jgi:hypothetical protein